MNKPKLNYQINLCVSKDNLQPSMTMIQVTKKHIFATDAHVLVHIPTSYIFDNESINNENWFDFYIEPNQYKLLLNSTAKMNINFETKIITTVKNTGIFNASFLSAGPLNYPDCKQVIDLSSDNLTDKNTLDVNLEYLTKVNKALNIQRDKGVKIHIKHKNQFHIFSKEYQEISYEIPFALVMGMRSE